MRGQWKEWQPGDPVLINRIAWGQPEIDQIQEVLDNDWFGPGAKVQEFAKSISDYTDIPHVQPVNSGSSALALAVEAMIHLGVWKPGDWILHPLLTFPTSIVPAIKAGLTPIFVDVDPNTYQIDLDLMGKAIEKEKYGEKIKGAIIPHLLGNISDMALLMDILDGRPFIEDCCDTLGSTYDGLHVGNFGHVAAFSFYGSHHITTAGVGGALATHSEEIYNYAKSATHWGRNDYALLDDQYEKFSKRYRYETLGSDCQMTEIQAAFGIAQMKRLDRANKKRAQRFAELDNYFSDLEDFFYLPRTDSDRAMPSWFCYPMTVKNRNKRGTPPFYRKGFAGHLFRNQIEIRPLFTGNILKHPAFGILPPVGMDRHGNTNADLAGSNGLFLPAWGMSDGEMAYLLDVLDQFFNGTHRYRRTYWRDRDITSSESLKNRDTSAPGKHFNWGVCPICKKRYNGVGHGEWLKTDSFACKACDNPDCTEAVKMLNRAAGYAAERQIVIPWKTDKNE